MTEFPKFIAMRDSGVSCADVYREGKREGLSEIESIRMLRVVFGLTLAEAKEVTITASGTALSLADHEAATAAELGRIGAK
jgi:ribosomal protein L7/L12